MYYSNLHEDTENIYTKDADGNVVYTEINGVSYPVLSEQITFYETPIEFEANISFNSGESQIAEFGLNTSDYNAIIVADKDTFPFSERTLIWHDSTPQVDQESHAIPETADYRVVAVKTSLNEERFILKKRVDSE